MRIAYFPPTCLWKWRDVERCRQCMLDSVSAIVKPLVATYVECTYEQLRPQMLVAMHKVNAMKPLGKDRCSEDVRDWAVVVRLLAR